MAENKGFKVVFKGERLPGHDIESVRSKLGSMLSLSDRKLQRLFSGKPVVVKKDISLEIATKYQRIFQKASAVCIILNELGQEVDPAPAESSEEGANATDVPPGHMTCPRCGLEQPQAADCEGCGIIIHNYLEQKSRLSPNPPDITLKDTTVFKMSSWQRILRALVILPLVAALFFFMLQKNISRDPQKYKLLNLANLMVNNLEACSRTIQESDAFKKITEAGYPVGSDTISLGQLSFLIQQSYEQSKGPEDSVVRIAATLEQRGIIRSVLSSNQALENQLNQLSEKQESFSSLHQKVLQGLIQFYELYSDFTRLILYPEKQKTLMAYHIQFRIQQGYVMTAYFNLVEALIVLEEKGFGKNKQHWQEELKTAREYLKNYRESALYFKVPGTPY